MKTAATPQLPERSSVFKMLFLFLIVGLSASETFAFPDTLWVNSRSSATVTGSTLLNGVSYEIEVTGTHTKWGANDWAQGACPGSENIAIFPNGANTKVGRDIYFRFGGPPCCTSCPNPLGTNSDVRFSIDGSAPSINFNTLAGPLTYSATHQYTSNITGQGQAIQMRFFDSLHSDNSGLYRIVIREAPNNAVPTLSQWGLIITGLLVLCLGAIVLHRRKAELQNNHSL
ncbi:MAG: IPTL-CTERM sorting domain-containing protein [Bacteroidota bacterium]